MRPDRIVVGECRSGEALDMLQAMNTGHDGSLTTVHSNSPRDTLARIETMVLMAGFDLPIRAIREQMASALDLIVHLTRLRDGTRRITHITEVQGMEGDVITLQDIFLFDYGMGVDEHGRFRGHLKATGVRPKFAEKLADLGIRLGPEVFQPEGFARRAVGSLMRAPFRFRDLRLAAVVVLIVSLLAGLSGTARADDDKRLVIRSVDALKYPDTHVTVLPVGPAPSPVELRGAAERRSRSRAVQAVPLTQVGVPVGVVYLVDTSNAMGKEEAMDKVKAALTDAVARRAPNQKIAIVSFGVTARVVSNFTTDPATLTRRDRRAPALARAA